MAKKTVLITGPTSGIGLELAKLFALDEYHLILVSRDKKRLEETAKELSDEFDAKSTIIVSDLTKRTSPKKIFDQVKKKKLTINALVNNAGFGSYGMFRDLPLAKEIDMIDLNVISLVELTGLFLPELIKKKGKILNIASTAAFQPIPLMATYAATKAFVLSYSEALRNELADSQVTVTTLCPGPTRTNFDKAAKMETTGLFSGHGVASAESVAQKGYDGLRENKGVVFVGVHNQAGATLAKMVPTSTSASLAKKILRKK